MPDLIKKEDISRLKFRLIVEGSNIPMSHESEELCHKKGIIVVPDFVANAGGVISSYIEYINGSEKDMFRMVEEKITANTRKVLEEAEKKNCSPKAAALEIAERRVKQPKSL